MITFPPARIPTDPEAGFEPYSLKDDRVPTEPAQAQPQKPRADTMVYAAGFAALRGKSFLTDDGRFFEVLEAPARYGAAEYFLWDGTIRRILTVGADTTQKDFLELLSNAWLYDRGEGDPLYDEARRHLSAARAYDPRKDEELLIANFELLLANTDRVLATPAMRYGALGGLSAVFIYCGRLRFPVSALLAAWREGAWKGICRRKKGEEHEAYALFGGGGLSMGEKRLYCPTCGARWSEPATGGAMLAAIQPYIPKRHDGLRLDEIIEELKGGGEAR